MTKTVFEISANITIIRDGDHGQEFNQDQYRKLETDLKKELGLDDIHIKSAKTFVTDGEEK